MSTKKFKVKNPETVQPCPKCGNQTEFIGQSAQVSEDSCDTWVECVCGYDPTVGSWGYRYEDVWGGCNVENLTMALEVWNEMILNQKSISKQSAEPSVATDVQ